MHARYLPLLSLLLPLSCLDYEETLVIRPDGSATMTVEARGDLGDLADGYAVPLHAPFVPDSPETLRWLADVAPDTGSRTAMENVRQVNWLDEEGKPAEKGSLRVRAELASLDQLPRYFSPESDPYRTAYLEHDAQLTVERRGDKTLYRFQRVLRGRQQQRWMDEDRLKDRLPKEPARKLENEEPLTDAEWAEVARVFAEHFRYSAAHFAREALLGIYTQGDASLPVEASRDIVAGAAEQVGKIVTAERFRQAYAEEEEKGRLRKLAQQRGERWREEPGGFDRMADQGRETLRRTLTDQMARHGVAERVQNAVLERLEWNLAYRDQTSDLGDETLRFKVALPGTLVGGNFDHEDRGMACYEVKGKLLEGGDVVLTAVSVQGRP